MLLKGRFLQQARPRPAALKGRSPRRVGGERAAAEHHNKLVSADVEPARALSLPVTEPPLT